MYTTEQLNSSLAGRYTIERLVGEGGMATVYVARDPNRKVALKVLKPDLGAIVGVERFLSEIEVTANLQHPNLLPLFDSGAADGLLFYVMPYVEGESLRTRLEREKQLPIDEAVRIATAVASALDYAHRRGVIHRDLKPENILLHEGQPLVADFGIALALSNAGRDRVTQTGLSLGTPRYMSPEQATGDRAIDARTDIYSLGAVTYEMLTGDPPHTGSSSQAIIARVLTERPRSIRSSRPNVPEHVEATVEQALEKLAADRFGSAREFSDALSGKVPVATRATSAAPVAGARGPDRQRALLGALGIVTVLWAITGVWLWRRPAAVSEAPEVRFDMALPMTSDRTPVVLAGIKGIDEVRFAPGVQQVSYGSNESGTWEVYVANYPSLDNRRQVSASGGRQARWKQDGKELYFLSSDGKVMVAARRPGSAGEFAAPEVLFESPLSLPSPVLNQWDVDASGRRFLFLVPESGEGVAYPLTVVLNWTNALKKN